MYASMVPSEPGFEMAKAIDWGDGLSETVFWVMVCVILGRSGTNEDMLAL
ncbi:hypothetical protein [Verticiella sediminum]|nr:hypothetical protein [Verticiella sediminum]